MSGSASSGRDPCIPVNQRAQRWPTSCISSSGMGWPVVTEGHHGAHLCRMQDDSICVDALDLADELRAAYDGRVKPRMQQAEFREQVETRFQEFRDSFRGIHRARQDWFAKVPQRYPVTAGDALAPNSPSVNAAYSTNVSGAPRVDDDSGG